MTPRFVFVRGVDSSRLAFVRAGVAVPVAFALLVVARFRFPFWLRLASRFAFEFLLVFELLELRFAGFFSVFAFEFDEVFDDELLSCWSFV